MAKIELSFPGAASDPGFTVRRFDVDEALSSPFSATLLAASPDPDLDFAELLGKPARLRLDRGPLGARAWSGLCASVTQVEVEPEGPSLYALRLVPSLWLLSQRSDHRIFQQLSAPAIARALLHAWGIEAVLRLDEASFPRLAYRAQRGESDLAFLSRLLEDAGLSYAFEEHEGESRLVLADAPERAEARPGALTYTATPSPTRGDPFLAEARITAEMRSGALALGDFDFRRPLYHPTYRALSAGPGEAGLERWIYAPGAALVGTSIDGAESAAVLAEAESRSDDRQGRAVAERRLDGLREGRRTLAFSTNVLDLAPGSVFTIAGAPRPELGPDRRFCVVSASIEGTADGELRVHALAAFADDPLKPAQKTPRPRIEGVENARVVGPEGEAIHVDEHGRVRLRFPWDREGALDEARTPWVRVAEGWAGAGFGMMAAPRVGDEVLVGFVEGDPDQPLVVGRVHGASTPAPFPLPGGRDRSVWRSRSTAGAGGQHEIVFDDRARHERLTLQSSRDLEKIVRRREVETTGGHRRSTVGGQLSATIGGEDRSTVGGVHAVSVGSATRREISAGRITLSTGDATIQLDGPDITVSGRAGVAIKAGGTVSIQGQPYVHLNPPRLSSGGAKPSAPEPAHLVWFKLVAEGQPLSGLRCHLKHPDGSTSSTQVTDGNGMVHLPVDAAGSYQLQLGKAPAGEGGAAATQGQVHVGTTPAQPRAKARPTEHAVPIAVEIVAPAPGSTFHLHTTPSMPTIPLEARVLVQGEEVTLGSLRWELRLTGHYRVRDQAGSGYRQQAYALPAGHARSRPGERVHFELAPGELVGGALEIKAVFHGGTELGGLTASKKRAGCRVLGKDPPRHEVEAFISARGGSLAWLYLRMFCHESNHQLAQFAQGSGGGNTPGFPLYGPPSGVGIVQRDPTAGEWRFPRGPIGHENNFFPRIFWDWKHNVAEGITSFHSDYLERGRRDLDLLRQGHPHLPMYPEGLLLRAAIRRYNGGTEFAASADGRHYVVSPAYTGNPGYVDDVLDDPHIHGHAVPAEARARKWP